MESDKKHFRHILLFYYRKGKNAVQARKKLTNVYGEGVLTVRQCQNWFAKFRSGNFDVEDAPRSGRSVEADKDAIKALVDANRRITTREIKLRLNLSNSTVYDHLKGLGLSSKLDVWVPHVLTERNLCRRTDVCDSLLKRHENYPFLKRIITGDEKGHGAKKMNQLKPFPKPIFTKKRFVEWAQNEIAVVPDFHKRILFSDEAHFWLNGYVNKQNCRIWSEANSQVYVETPLHPEKLTVWCALWAGGIFLQKR
ncbi:histone-lysine N-methyltransferase SETMAR [Trichonephila clavipes]|nr:histone-lysine N-methyltransferase SETMAR [Trichonephila clavipes]